MLNNEIKNVISWGNGAGVLLPREWVGKQVKVILVDRTEQIKKEVLSIIDKYLPKIIGIYLVGSYSRNEQTKDSDIDILVISHEINKEIISGKYHISIVDLESIKKTLQNNPIMIYPRLIEAKAIINENFLKEFKKTEVKGINFKSYLEETYRIIKINKKLIEIESSKYVDSSVVYSLILRLRGIFIIKSFPKSYSSLNFKKWIVQEISPEDYEKAYSVYRGIRDNRKIKIKVEISIVKNLLELLEKEVKTYGKKR